MKRNYRKRDPAASLLVMQSIARLREAGMRSFPRRIFLAKFQNVKDDDLDAALAGRVVSAALAGTISGFVHWLTSGGSEAGEAAKTPPDHVVHPTSAEGSGDVPYTQPPEFQNVTFSETPKRQRNPFL